MSGRRVAVLGATGLVGREMLLTLEQRNFPVSELVPLASERSEGKKVTFRGEEVTVRAVKEDSFKDVDIALFSAEKLPNAGLRSLPPAERRSSTTAPRGAWTPKSR